ncbi:K(+) efflux antiporter 3, chloroplastic, partial [Tanacetum coccineum]
IQPTRGHLVNLDSQVPIVYGDGSRAALLESAGISSLKAVMVMYEGRQRAVKVVERIRLAFPAVTYSTYNINALTEKKT